MFESGSKTCCLISGASRGFGRSVAVALAGQFSDSGTKGHFILISRSGDDLEETRNTIIQVCATAEGKASHIRSIGDIMRQFSRNIHTSPPGQPARQSRASEILNFWLVSYTPGQKWRSNAPP